MRSLAQPRVLRASAIASVLTTLASWPRLALWPARVDAVGVILSLIAVCSFFLWNFVFGWHERYAKHAVFRKPEPKLWGWVTALALATAVSKLLLVDPVLRPLAPDEFPQDLAMWGAMMLFSVGLTTVFLLFAPFAFFARLTGRVNGSAAATAGFGVLVAFLAADSRPEPLPSGVLATVLVARAAGGALAVWLYLRGGAGLVWWWTLIVQARHLPALLTGGAAGGG